MDEFIILLRDFYGSILSLFSKTVITLGGVQTSLGGIIFACLIIGISVSVFWKGAKT